MILMRGSGPLILAALTGKSAGRRGMLNLREGMVFSGSMRKNQPRIGANPALRAPRIGFASPHLNSAVLIVPPVHPSSGTFGQILSPPQRLHVVWTGKQTAHGLNFVRHLMGPLGSWINAGKPASWVEG